MKKTLLFILLFLYAYTVFSQQKDENAPKFESFWFMQLQGGVAHTIGENNFLDLISPSMALSVGYQLNPLMGLRVNLSGWQSKGGWIAPYEVYKYNYLQGGVDAILNLNNLFYKYNAQRIFNTYAFIGAGINNGFNNDEAIAIDDSESKLSNLWRDNKCFAVGRLGLGSDIRLREKLYLNIEVNTNIYSDKYNSKKAGNADWQFNALAGITFKFGKKTKKEIVMTQLVKSVPSDKKETKPMAIVVKKDTITKASAKVTIKPLKKDIFFTFNSSYIRKDEEVKIDALVTYLNQYPECKISVIGYADADTGNTVSNKKVSQRRSVSVSDMLKAKGIADNRIITDYKGDSIQPFENNNQNRVAICIVE